jgi:hypothetical protein
MITTRTNQLQPTNNHKNRKVTLISIVNYDKFQYVDKEQSHTDRISQQVLIKHNLNNNLNTINKNKSSKEYEEIGTEGEYIMLRKKSDGKKYLKHKFKDIPLKDY